VAGTVCNLIFTRLISRPGWLTFLFPFYLYTIRNKNFINRIDLKTFQIISKEQVHLGTGSIMGDVRIKSTTPAAISSSNTLAKLWSGHPSLKRRGEYYEGTGSRYKNLLTFIDPYLKTFLRPLKLTSMPLNGQKHYGREEYFGAKIKYL
jgi:hypothetical protein